MTLVAAWMWHHRLVLAADTRLSKNTVVMSDRGPKILPLTVRSGEHPHGKSYTPYPHFNIGFAYAGSTLAASNTCAMAAAFLQNLTTTIPGHGPPSMDGIAEIIRIAAEHQIRDLSIHGCGTQVSFEQFFFEALVAGFCPKKLTVRLFVLAPGISPEGFRVLKQEVSLPPNGVCAIGSGRERFRGFMKSGMNPHAAILEIVKNSSVPDVGGNLQVGQVIGHEFRLTPVLSAAERSMSFLGIDNRSMGLVEDFSVSGPEAYCFEDTAADTVTIDSIDDYNSRKSES